jgi:hypothetical protein
VDCSHCNSSEGREKSIDQRGRTEEREIKGLGDMLPILRDSSEVPETANNKSDKFVLDQDEKRQDHPKMFIRQKHQRSPFRSQ